jgi:hypothetical protein
VTLIIGNVKIVPARKAKTITVAETFFITALPEN